MIHWSINLSMLFREVPFLDRFQAASDAGFHVVEFHWPHGVDLNALVDAKETSGVEVALFNINAGDLERGVRGFPHDPDRMPWWRERVEKAIGLAERLNTPRINALAGNMIPNLTRTEMLDCLCDNLQWAVLKAEALDIKILLEPLNRLEHPVYLLSSTSEAVEIIDRIDNPSVQLQFDVYHAQRTEGNLVNLIKMHIGKIGHVQIADSPDRNQPGKGEINWRFVLSHLETLGYTGFVGLEYNPVPSTLDSLIWLPRPMRQRCEVHELTL